MGELKIFATRIKELRNSLKMTQKDFSEYIGIKQQTLSGYERGIMKPPLDIAKEIAEKCNVSIDWLCGLSNKRKESTELTTYSDIINELIKIKDKIKINFDSGKILVYNKKINKFLGAWRRMIKLHSSGTIDDDLYNLWMTQQLENYNTEILSKDGTTEFEEECTSED